MQQQVRRKLEDQKTDFRVTIFCSLSIVLRFFNPVTLK